MSQRTSTAAEWGDAVPLPDVINSEEYTERSPHLSPDGLELYFGRGTGVVEWNSYDLWVSKRGSPTDDWGIPEKLAINSSTEDAFPSLSRDGLELYFETDRRDPNSSDIFVSKRASLSDSFETAELAISSAGGPDLSSDGLFLFSDYCETDDNCDLRLSRRSSTSETFGPAIRLVGPINSSAHDFDPALSGDGTTIYFASERPGVPLGGGQFSDGGIWQATVLSVPEPSSVWLMSMGILALLRHPRSKSAQRQEAASKATDLAI